MEPHTFRNALELFKAIEQPITKEYSKQNNDTFTTSKIEVLNWYADQAKIYAKVAYYIKDWSQQDIQAVMTLDTTLSSAGILDTTIHFYYPNPRSSKPQVATFKLDRHGYATLEDSEEHLYDIDHNAIKDTVMDIVFKVYELVRE